jgi:hypothetical protein
MVLFENTTRIVNDASVKAQEILTAAVRGLSDTNTPQIGCTYM